MVLWFSEFNYVLVLHSGQDSRQELQQESLEETFTGKKKITFIPMYSTHSAKNQKTDEMSSGLKDNN